VLEVETEWIGSIKVLLVINVVLSSQVLFTSVSFDFSCEKQMLSWGGVQGLSVE
jgi:hypothetical protein